MAEQIIAGIIVVMLGGLGGWVARGLRRGHQAVVAQGQAEEHAELLTRKECAACDARHSAERNQGNELFRLILEGQAIHTQALIAICNDDEECRDLKAALQAHLGKLASRQIGR